MHSFCSCSNHQSPCFRGTAVMLYMHGHYAVAHDVSRVLDL